MFDVDGIDESALMILAFVLMVLMLSMMVFVSFRLSRLKILYDANRATDSGELETLKNFQCGVDFGVVDVV